jgi:hypothetical protein
MPYIDLPAIAALFSFPRRAFSMPEQPTISEGKTKSCKRWKQLPPDRFDQPTIPITVEPVNPGKLPRGVGSDFDL